MLVYFQDYHNPSYSHTLIYSPPTIYQDFSVGTIEDGRIDGILLSTLSSKRYCGFHIAHYLLLGTHILGEVSYMTYEVRN